MNEIAGLILGLVLFLCTLIGYITGLKHGKELSKGNVPAMQLNPVKKALEVVEAHQIKKEESKLTEELTDIMGATRESMTDYIKKAR